MSTNGNQLKPAIEEALKTLSADVVSKLTVEQQAALEGKWNMLPVEVRSSIAAKYPAMSTVAMYIVRQSVKESNSAMASKLRPQWYSNLTLNAASIKSGEAAIREYGEKQLRTLAESLDSKESVTLLKKYKTAHDTTSKDAHIVQLCGIFGVSPASLS